VPGRRECEEGGEQKPKTIGRKEKAGGDKGTLVKASGNMRGAG